MPDTDKLLPDGQREPLFPRLRARIDGTSFPPVTKVERELYSIAREAAAALELLAGLLDRLASDLESANHGEYRTAEGPLHPLQQRRFERDMKPVDEARAALDKLGYTPLEVPTAAPDGDGVDCEAGDSTPREEGESDGA